ncbi:MAG TPA: M23 family metallopeptidase [Brevundimonas sp.]|jgi:murein DD-endopeptidase MepM/ murein hydrolase activator NlpD
MKAAAALAVAALIGCRPAQAPAPRTALQAEPAPLPVAMPLPGIRVEGRFIQGGLATGTAPDATAALLVDGQAIPLAEGGRFLLGFDRDHGPKAVVEARLADGRTLRREIAVAARTWRIEHVNVAQRPSTASADYLRRRERELARIGAARAQGAQSSGWSQRFIWPASGRISGVFGSQRVYRGVPAAYHSGVDIAAASGATVVAPADGVVVLAGPPAFSLEGNLVILDHGMGLNSAFLHLSGTVVREGQSVRQGEAIGSVGATGRATGPHLHWSMKWTEARIDPAILTATPAPQGR